MSGPCQRSPGRTLSSSEGHSTRLSSILYVICIEPLCHKIRSDPNIKGLQPPTPGPEIKLTAYADDNNPVVSDISSIKNVINTATQFGLASGGRLNLGKSTGVLLGPAKQWSLPEKFCGIKWVPFSRVLGCRLGSCDISKENWDRVSEKAEEAIESHKTRDLSLRGKAIIINSVVLSKLWYVGRIFLLPNNYLESLNTSIFKGFLWKSTEWIARETLYLKPSDGGIGLINIELKLRAFRILHIIDFLYGEWHPWKDLASYWISMDLRGFRQDLFTNASPHSSHKPDFYNTAVREFTDFQSKHPDLTLIGLTSKRVYEILLDDVNHQLRIVQRNPTVDYISVFASCDDKLYCPQVRSLTYQIAHEVIRTRQRLHHFDSSRYRDDKCPSCRTKVESHDHLFYQCPVTRDVWSVVQDIFYGLCNHRLRIDRMLVIYNLFPPLLTKSDLFIAKQVVGYAKLAIYDKRNKLVANKGHYNSQNLLYYFLYLLKSRVRADNHRLPDRQFKKLWCHKNVICAKVGSTVEFCF